MSLPDKQPFSIYSLRGCLLVFFILILAIGTSAGIAIAKVGLVEIPILSKVFYQPAKPSRVVPKLKVEEQGNQGLESLLPGAGQNPGLGEVIKLNESQASQLINAALADQTGLTGLQLVFLDKKIELFGRLDNQAQTPVKLLISPSFFEKTFSIRVNELEIGDLNVPVVFLNIIINTFFAEKIRELETKLTGSPLRGFQIRDGEIEIELEE